MLGVEAMYEALALGIGGAAHRQGNGTEAELEEAIPARRWEIVVPLWRGARDEFDLTGVEAKPLIGRARLRLDGAIVGKEYALRAAFDDRRSDAAVGDVGKALRGEQDGDILLAQGLQPFADASR